ncbi:MarR family transcriptional regulator [Bradyrhizobium diazoefficiens]|jgi:MarR family transcriptional regulator, transcriptional regulator for hemolysin|uniref:Putative transcriptional regulatory protein regulator for hemolysin n=1 Tax=Bradyrhizobium diazoefficiens SEMIA 5080 TaxID=754504 RepID=A0A837CK62_9BRAD|nr:MULTISPECIES: MarR family transcriptional regulator [Bradyrhizobium]APO54088.1 transcriptional regulator [Bradyrhizobium diazoefficiens]KGJ69405.1 putative transcriptional regulatory protein regulator for hemolysin [Bradyrhizobium diazoefficiens SEMIA 5080]KOY11057.1 transcriptional regulator [Bradyrhizobium diazoefficiens]MCD9292167.1 MarR family transcriptional regulator [Bradyrhizobium diazoefficiens]MCD9808351.1 MarR family transcriptional regulator [Bradyrhizobium diazoefficiens]
MAPSQGFIHAEIGRLITRLGRMWRRESDQALSDHGLSYATAIPLLLLSRQGENVRQGVLADELGIEGPSLVRLIDLLQAEGLVERREDPTDRRAKTLHLTKAGEAKVEETNRVLRRVRASLLKDIGADELAITFETLQRIEQRAGRLHEAKMFARTFAESK